MLPYIDIFSISIKSIDPEYYKKVTTGWVEPVLEATKQVFKAGKHVEVSTLMVTDISDDEETAVKIADWLLTELSPEVPLHYVRFHPDYKMNNSTRMPIPRLLRAREIAREMGVKHVYLGNVNGEDATNTKCLKCTNLLVTRYGLNAVNVGMDDNGHCKKCGFDMNFKLFKTPPRFNYVDKLCMQTSLQYGFKRGLLTGFGAAAADGVYGLIAACGLTGISTALIQHRAGIQLIGGLFLLYLGIKTVLSKGEAPTAKRHRPNPPGKYSLIPFY